MRVYSHVLLGAGSWLTFAELADAAPEASTTVAAVLGSLLPDIDHPQSFAGRRLRWVSLPLSRLIGHRGLTHSLCAALGATWLLTADVGLQSGAAQALAVGYLSHLLADWVTPAGVPLLWPWRRRFTAPLTLKTGGALEALLDIVLGAWLLWAVLPVLTVE